MAARQRCRRRPEQKIETASIALGVVVVRLVEKINRGFKYTLGDRMMDASLGAAMDINTACGYCPVRKRARCLESAQEQLLRLETCVKMALVGGQVTVDEKSKFDVFFEDVLGQLQDFLAATNTKISSGQGPGGNAPGEMPD